MRLIHPLVYLIIYFLPWGFLSLELLLKLCFSSIFSSLHCSLHFINPFFNLQEAFIFVLHVKQQLLIPSFLLSLMSFLHFFHFINSFFRTVTFVLRQQDLQYFQVFPNFLCFFLSYFCFCLFLLLPFTWPDYPRLFFIYSWLRNRYFTLRDPYFSIFLAFNKYCFLVKPGYPQTIHCGWPLSLIFTLLFLLLFVQSIISILCPRYFFLLFA